MVDLLHSCEAFCIYIEHQLIETKSKIKRTKNKRRENRVLVGCERSAIANNLSGA